MATMYVEEERTVDAPLTRVYDLLADYAGAHRRILPQNYADYRVERGGRGAGTRIAYTLNAARRSRHYVLDVTEPTSGKTLLERDTGSSLMTTWTLIPDGEQRTRVRLATEWQGGSGVGGFFERTFAPRGLARIYRETLGLLAQAAADTPAPAAASAR